MLGTPVVITDQDARDTSATQIMALGTKAVTPDGRVYRYTKAGASDLAPGKLAVNADLVANHVNRTVYADAAIGANSVRVNLGATAATLNQYKDGYLTVNDATGEGIQYKIVGNTAASSSGVVTVKLAEPLKVALVASTSEVTLKKNPWADVVISATDQQDQPVGVPNVTIPATYFGWVQTGGECAVWADEDVVRGQALTIGTGTAGAVEALDAAGEFQLGIASEAMVDTEYRGVYLTMDS